MSRAESRDRNFAPVLSLLAVCSCLNAGLASAQSTIATPGTSGDQLLFVFDATEGRVPFLVVSNLASEAVVVEVAWYAQKADGLLETQTVTLAEGGNSIFDPSQTDGVDGNAGIAVVTPIRSLDDRTPVVPPSPPGTESGALFGGFTLANVATNSGFGQNPLARLAVDADGERAPSGSTVDGDAVRYQAIAPDVLVLPFYFDPSSQGMTNQVILGAFTDQYAGDAFRIGSVEAEFPYRVLDSTGTELQNASGLFVSGVRFEDVQNLAAPVQLTTSGKIVFAELGEGSAPNRNVFGLMTQALGTFSVGQRMPGVFASGAPTERWTENGDGTATDNTTGLQWELKTGERAGSVLCDSPSTAATCADPHHVNNAYSYGGSPTLPTGSVLTAFLTQLNGGTSDVTQWNVGTSEDPPRTVGCFAGSCDWRLPTLEELTGIMEDVPGCTDESVPVCTTIPGSTRAGYFSITTGASDPESACAARFDLGFANCFFSKGESAYEGVRAVRGPDG